MCYSAPKRDRFVPLVENGNAHRVEFRRDEGCYPWLEKERKTSSAVIRGDIELCSVVIVNARRSGDDHVR